MTRSSDDTITWNQVDSAVYLAAKGLPGVGETQELSDRTYLLIKRLAAFAAVLFILLYVVLAVYRMSYPYELEWMEGGMLQHVQRVLSGKPLYCSPTLEFTPFIYPPLYYYMCAPVALIAPSSLMSLRLVSVAASIGCLVLIYLIVRHETRNTWASVLASGLYAATFPASGTWFDIARVDSLLVLFLLLTIYILRRGDSLVYQLAAGLCVLLAYLTKQIALVAAAPLVIWWLYSKRRQGLAFAIAVSALVGGATLLLDVLYEGWFTYYMLELPRQHAGLSSVYITFWITDVLSPLFVGVAVGCFALVQFRRTGETGKWGFFLAVTAGLVAGSYLSRVHSGGWDNVLMPCYAAICVMFGLGLSAVQDWSSQFHAGRTASFGVLLCSLCLLQFAVLSYNPADIIPTVDDRLAGTDLVRELSDYEGDVLIPGHGYLAGLAGKTSYAHEAALVDVLRGRDSVPRAQLVAELRRVLTDQQFDAIYMDGSSWYLPDIQLNYRIQGTVFADKTSFYPVVGTPARPQFIYLPRESSTSAQDRKE